MNLLLLRESDITHCENATIWIDDYRAEHMIKVMKVSVGQQISVGRVNGNVGHATIEAIENKQVALANVKCEHEPPKQLPVDVILALPRPRMLQRSLQTMATMGVKTIHLIHTERVEKSFWQTPLLKTEAITEQLILGAEQAKATQLPIIQKHPKWHIFANEILPSLKHRHKIIGHPGDYPGATQLSKGGDTSLAIGPEGGFTSTEVSVFTDNLFTPVQLGERILRVETAVPVLLAKLF